jgi:anti-sigma B factor antagonist
LSTPFEIAVDRGAAHTTLSLRGELDMATAPRLDEALEHACAERAGEIVLDLAGLEFIDSSGVRAILLGREVCARNGCEYSVLRDLSASVERLFAMAGVGEWLTMRDEPPADDDLQPQAP